MIWLVVCTKTRALFTLLPLGKQPSSIAVKAFPGALRDSRLFRFLRARLFMDASPHRSTAPSRQSQARSRTKLRPVFGKHAFQFAGSRRCAGTETGPSWREMRLGSKRLLSCARRWGRRVKPAKVVEDGRNPRDALRLREKAHDRGGLQMMQKQAAGDDIHARIGKWKIERTPCHNAERASAGDQVCALGRCPPHGDPAA